MNQRIGGRVSLLSFQANVYTAPASAVDRTDLTLRGVALTAIRRPGGGPPPFVRPLPASFEAIQQGLARLPRCDVEPDGYFLLTGHEAGVFWRLNGHMHEYDGSMHRVELNGECPSASLDTVLAILGGDRTELLFELVQEGVTLNEADLRRYAVALG